MIVQHDLTEIPADSIKFDKKNPNQMTDLQQEGLGSSLKRFGSVQPIIVMRNELDANGKIKVKGKNLIANGEHRAKELIKSGVDKIKCIYIDMTEGERLLLRQIGNKMGGQHDRVMDAAELKLLQKLGLKDDFNAMMAMSDSEYQKTIELASTGVAPDHNTVVDITTKMIHRCIVPDCPHGAEE